GGERERFMVSGVGRLYIPTRCGEAASIRRKRDHFCFSKKAKHALSRMCGARRGETKPRLAILPLKSAFGVAEQHIRGFEEAQTGEHLPRIEEIDGDGGFRHHAASWFAGGWSSSAR